MHRMHKAHWNPFTKKAIHFFSSIYEYRASYVHTSFFLSTYHSKCSQSKSLRTKCATKPYMAHSTTFRDEFEGWVLLWNNNNNNSKNHEKKTIHTPKKPQSECAMRVKVDGVAKATSMKIGRTRQKLNWINVSLIRNESLEHTMCLFLFFFVLVLFLYYHFATILVAISTASLFLRCNFFNRSIIIIRYFLYTSHPRYAWPYVYTWIFTAAVCAIFFFFRLFFFLLFSVASVQFPTCTDYNITYAPVVCSTFSRLVFNFSGVSVLLLTDNDCRCIAPCACLHIHNE